MKYIISILSLCFTDLWIKGRIDKMSPSQVASIKMGPLLRLEKVRNSGLPFGFLRENKALVRTAPAVLLLLLSGALLDNIARGRSRARKISLVLLISGGLSNLLDRLKKGYVVDYAALTFGPFRKIVWNLGDLFVLVGSILYGLSNTGERLELSERLERLSDGQI